MILHFTERWLESSTCSPTLGLIQPLQSSNLVSLCKPRSPTLSSYVAYTEIPPRTTRPWHFT